MKILIYFEPLPAGIHGAAIQDNEDHSLFWLLCDSNAHQQRRRYTFGHELAHIFCGHFNTEDPLKVYPKEKVILQRGTILQENDHSFRDTSSEHSADRNAWHYYRRFRDQFIQAEKTGRATIMVGEEV